MNNFVYSFKKMDYISLVDALIIEQVHQYSNYIFLSD